MISDEQIEQIELKTERQRQLIESAQYQAYVGIRPEDVQVLITALRQEREKVKVATEVLEYVAEESNDPRATDTAYEALAMLRRGNSNAID